MNRQEEIKQAQEHFARLLDEQYARIDNMRQADRPVDYTMKEKIIIGVGGGDGIGPYITAWAKEVLDFLLADEVKAGRIVFREIEDLTLEERIKAGKAIPDGPLEALKMCDVILKGPTTTPRAGDGVNVESANVAMRRELDLFANVRPVKVPQLGIDWTFYRENTEGAYAVGSKGIELADGLGVDFTITTQAGSERIIRAAFDYAVRSGQNRLTVVTKANVIKTTDGMFLQTAKQMAGEYPQVVLDDWYIDIMTAKLLDDKRRRDFKVVVLPNLYGDIITDEAAEIQGGVGTAGSANIGNRYAMFEAIHGSAPRMVEEGRAAYADPSSMLRACVMLLEHIGQIEKAAQLAMALDICTLYDRQFVITGRKDGSSAEAFCKYVMQVVQDKELAHRYAQYTQS